MAKAKASKTVRNLSTFRANHDRNVIIPAKIRAALAEMEKNEGPESYAYESTDTDGGVPFVKRAGINQTDLGLFRELFKDHIVETAAHHGRAPRRVWFATVKAAKVARGA